MDNPSIITDFRQRFAYARDADARLFNTAIRIPNAVSIEVAGSNVQARDADGNDISDAINTLAECIDESIIYPPSIAEFSSPVRKGHVVILPAGGPLPEIHKGDLVVLPHLSRVNNPQQFVDLMLSIKEKTYDAVVYAPGCALPWRVAFFAYFGVDITDTAGLHGETINYTRDGPMPITTGLFNQEEEVKREIITLRHAISSNTLRELVERRALVEPWMMAALRYSDLRVYPQMEYHYPVSCAVNASSREALNRPDIQRFRERITSRYEKPPFARVLLLTPCSAKKPYSHSKTHQVLTDVIRSAGAYLQVHRVVITSPLGVVPEELDIVPPASCYDIPVIGVWDENECSMITSCLETYLKTNKYDYIINHATDAIPSLKHLSNTTTLDGHPLSTSSLEKLKLELRRYSSTEEDKSLPRIWKYKAVSRFQFGVPLGIDSIKTCQDTTHLYSCGEEVGYSKSSLISLAPAGAKQLLEKKVHIVEIGDFPLKGDIFAPGVISASSDFRVGDQVVVHAGGILRAIGTAVMTPREMVELDKGLAIRVHTRIKE